eukprot:CAMPEP_0204535380 /NCGR_PEP_ID=MMETSP0661-20131031/13663_1 /ASSEMBLY_ACC=CAM_ASM_000606 /TAXON_ID=109239 /ORGANISM="Alexandrium margalefi, Strain AMGDE01CS-322" /LENGTH=47 /DNA_ID= /DNA_START= /DNA_END= /DNA_ORIENTATION=
MAAKGSTPKRGCPWCRCLLSAVHSPSSSSPPPSSMASVSTSASRAAS